MLEAIGAVEDVCPDVDAAVRMEAEALVADVRQAQRAADCSEWTAERIARGEGVTMVR